MDKYTIRLPPAQLHTLLPPPSTARPSTSSQSSLAATNPQAPPTLPKTIEGATRRYYDNYRRYFVGCSAELERLQSAAEARLLRLRKKAPKFYEDKLPTLVNQGASRLLTCDTSNARGVDQFNNNHREFLLVLDNLVKSQPDGEINFQAELDRVKLRDQLIKDQLRLRRELAELEAVELSLDDLVNETGCDNWEACQKKKGELARVTMLLAKIEGEEIDEALKFELVIPHACSLLTRLSKPHLQKLEEQMKSHLSNFSSRREVVWEPGQFFQMVESLELDPNRYPQDLMRQLAKDLSDAYKHYTRSIDEAAREQYHEMLLNDITLKPKEGRILEGPDDVPAHIKEEMDLDLARTQRRIQERLENCEQLHDEGPDFDTESARRSSDDGDEYDDDDDDRDSNHEGILCGERLAAAIKKEVEQNNLLFSRVKEEPREDYEGDAPSEDELELDEDEADQVEITLQLDRTGNRVPLGGPEEDAPANADTTNPVPPNTCNKRPQATPSIPEAAASTSNDTGHTRDLSPVDLNKYITEINNLHSNIVGKKANEHQEGSSSFDYVPLEKKMRPISDSPAEEKNNDDDDDDDVVFEGIVRPDQKVITTVRIDK